MSGQEPTAAEVRAETVRKVAEASELLDEHLSAIVHRSRRLLLVVITVQTVIILVLGAIAGYALHTQNARITDDIFAAQHDSCAVFLAIGTGSFTLAPSTAAYQAIEAAREVYATHGCAPALARPSPALQAAAARYGVKIPG